MQVHRLSAGEETGAERTVMLVLDKGEQVIATLTELARREGITAARFDAIGAFSTTQLAFFDRASREYRELPVDEQAEVVSLIGSIGVYERNPRVHAHAVLGMPDGSTRGGHLIEATVWPTLELSLTIGSGTLSAALDEETNLPLLRRQRP